jgi:D-sedoheptulose 7-phosphate isomerase
MPDDISDLFRQIAANMTAVADGGYPQAVSKAVDLVYEAFASGQKLLVFGNGGSSADAQHFSAEFVGRFVAERRALPAIALTTNQAVLTAWSNDYSFDDVFARQIEAIGSKGDIAFGISTSGTSAKHGGGMASLCDVLLAVPLTSTARIQEVHLVTYHAICAAVEARILASATSRQTR